MKFIRHMKFFVAMLLLTCSSYTTQAQSAYIQNNFSAVRSDVDQVYGIQTNFSGIEDTLHLDIYKPVGDSNCLRPLLVLVHGGSWIGGSKLDQNIVFIAQEMA